MSDRYDEQIEQLKKEDPDNIKFEWNYGRGIFKRLGYTGNSGCLTQIRSSPSFFGAFGPSGEHFKELTEEIANDERIPTDESSITEAHFSMFADYQRRFDKLYEEKAEKSINSHLNTLINGQI